MNYLANKRKTSKAANTNQGKREAVAVLFIAIGLFLGVSLYSDAVGVLGKRISDFIFALFGLGAYALPAAIIIGAIFAIASSKSGLQPAPVVLSCLGIMFILVIIHIYTRPIIENIAVLDYYTDAYRYGETARLGGGLIGALIAYPSLLLIGSTGSYIFFSAGIVAVFLLVTKLSLRSAGEAVGNSIKEGITVAAEQSQKKRTRLYSEQLSNTQYYDQPSDLAVKYEKPKRKAKKTPVPSYQDGELDVLPNSGLITKRPVMPQANHAGDMHSRTRDGNDEYLFSPQHPATDLHAAVTQSAGPRPIEYVSGPSKEAPVALYEVPTEASYTPPPITLLDPPKINRVRAGESIEEKKRILVDTLASFNINARVMNISVGPVITRYELQPEKGVRVNRITSLSNDLALALAAPRVRIEAPIPGKAAIGIEIPNKNIAGVCLREIIESSEFSSSKSPITFALGKDIGGKIITADLDKMPHLLIAGSTGSGKSVCINNIIVSMIYRSSPHDLGLILIDPKVVELSVFSTLPHLLVPVVTDAKRAASALRWVVLQMEQRYQEMAKFGARNTAGYNALPENKDKPMPKMVVVIDELADLMMVAAKEVEESICRIAQLGRAAGIHLIVATQRPSADIITGLIKANIPSRIAFMVSSAIDSRVIMDTSGAEKLLGRGDMLFHANGANKPTRIQGAFISDEEVEHITHYFAQNRPAEEQSAQNAHKEKLMEDMFSATAPAAQGKGKQEDELLPEAVKIVLNSGNASISMIQRRLRVGYARAARLIDIMEQMNIVSASDGSKPRNLLIDQAQFEQIFGGESIND